MIKAERILSAFCDGLVKKYETSYEEILGKSLTQLKEEWMEQLLTMEISITEEDILRNISG